MLDVEVVWCTMHVCEDFGRVVSDVVCCERLGTDAKKQKRGQRRIAAVGELPVSDTILFILRKIEERHGDFLCKANLGKIELRAPDAQKADLRKRTVNLAR